MSGAFRRGGLDSAVDAPHISAMLARLFSLAANLAFAAVVAGIALPGPHRVVLAKAYGLTEIAPRVWTDAPDRASGLLPLVTTARATVAGFFQDAPATPTMILCATRACAQTFGIGGNGLSVADLAILVSPGGLTVGTLTHELTHSRLHRSMGPSNILRQPFPTWFDEGLATHVAGHPNRRLQITGADRARVRQVTRSWQWDDAYRDLGVTSAYMAAAAEVAEIEARAGRAGLLDLIARVEAGEDFTGVLAQVMSR